MHQWDTLNNLVLTSSVEYGTVHVGLASGLPNVWPRSTIGGPSELWKGPLDQKRSVWTRSREGKEMSDGSHAVLPGNSGYSRRRCPFSNEKQSLILSDQSRKVLHELQGVAMG